MAASAAPAAGVRGAQSVTRAVSVLNAFSETRPLLTVGEVAAIVGLKVPTAHRLVRALTSAGFLVFDAHTRSYSLGPQILRLSNVMVSRDDLPNVAEPSLVRLRDLTGETVGLHWLMGSQRVCVYEVVSPHPIRMTSGLGSAYPLSKGAASKAILSLLEASTRQELLSATAEAPAGMRRARLLSEVDEAAARGYATSAGETTEGAAAVAAPIRRLGGGVGAINITGPANRFTPKRMRAAVKPLLAEAARIHRVLGIT
jgi:DNA-binding IclR family transcriptional regulator